MDGEQTDSEIYEPTAWERIEPALTTIATWAMNVGLAIAVLSAAYLMLGVIGGGLNGFNAQPHEQRVRVMANITLASNALYIGAITAAIGAAIAFFTVDTTGYVVFGGAVIIGLGIPYICRLTAAGQSDSFGVAAALDAYLGAATIPGVIGGLLIFRDIVKRLINGMRSRKLDHKELTYGTDAKAGGKPVRTSLMAKCWEGPYCREFIRPHCPIFISRKACWREKRGCYCEEDIVAAASAHINGIVLDMAPDPKQNYANVARPVGQQVSENAYRSHKPSLSYAQKVQRCKYCVIFNEHEREKYQLLVPVVIVGTVVLSGVFAPVLKGAVGGILSFMQSIVERFSFNGNTNVPKIAEPSAIIEWILIGALVLVIVSKMLQALEWMCFKAKI